MPPFPPRVDSTHQLYAYENILVKLIYFSADEAKRTRERRKCLPFSSREQERERQTETESGRCCCRQIEIKNSKDQRKLASTFKG